MADSSLIYWMDEGGTVLYSPERIRDLSYRQVVESHQGSSQAQRILDYLLIHPEGATNNELNRVLFGGQKINAVCGRVNELRKMGLISSGGARIDSVTGKLNAYWIAGVFDGV